MTCGGIYFETMCLSAHRKWPLGSGWTQVRERGMVLLEKAVRFSRDLGIRIIRLAGYDVYYEESTPETGRLLQENLEAGWNGTPFSP